MSHALHFICRPVEQATGEPPCHSINNAINIILDEVNYYAFFFFNILRAALLLLLLRECRLHCICMSIYTFLARLILRILRAIFLRLDCVVICIWCGVAIDGTRSTAQIKTHTQHAHFVFGALAGTAHGRASDGA